MYYKTTESLLAFIKKSPTAFQATAEMEKKFAENGYQLLFRAGILEVTAGREIYRNKKSFGIDCIFDSKEGVSEVSYYRQPQRFSGF